MVKTFCEKNYEWSVNGLEKCIEDNNLKSNIIVKSDTAAIVHVISYADSQILGRMTEWCISQHKCSWIQYVEKNNNFQTFIYDFSKKPTHQLSIVGATWKKNNKGVFLDCSFTCPNHPLAEATGHETDIAAMYKEIIYPVFDGINIEKIIEKEINENKVVEDIHFELPKKVKEYYPSYSYNFDDFDIWEII